MFLLNLVFIHCEPFGKKLISKRPVRLLIGRHSFEIVRLSEDSVKTRPCKKYHDIPNNIMLLYAKYQIDS